MPHPWKAFRTRAAAIALFFAFFSILLSPAPLSGSFLGSVDTLFVPALGDTVANRIVSAVTGEFVGQSMYPADILRYGETAFGTGIVFMAFHFLGASDVVAVYLVQVLLLTLMALATMILVECLTRSFPAAIVAALVFASSNFVWADIDHLPIHFFFFPLLSLTYLIRAAEGGRGRDLFMAGLLGGLQIYFSVQVFAYQCLVLGVFGLFHLRSLWRLAWKWKMLFVVSYVGLALPLVGFYLHTVLQLHPIDVWPRSANEEIYSLQLMDLVRHLPGKLVDYPFTRVSGGGWKQVAHSAFPGLVAPILALLGLRGMNATKAAFVTVAFLALLFSLGTTLEIGRATFTSPLALFYEYVPLAKYLRVGIRAYSLVLLSLSVLAAYGWVHLSAWLRSRAARLPAIGLLAVLALVAAENISLPVNRFEILPYPAVPHGYVEYFRDQPEALILDLPSRSTSWPFYIDDIVYTLWQTKHQRNIIGGVNGYYPQSRMDVQRLTDKLPSAAAFQYFRELGATHFVWHKSPFLVCRPVHSTSLGCNPVTGGRWATEAQGPDWLDSTPFLETVFEDEALKIYELR